MTSAPATVDHLVWLDRSTASRSLVGGKGASLGQLAALGAPVPPAFALTTHAYALFAGAHGLPRRVADVSEHELGGIRDAIAAEPLPSPVAEAIARGFGSFQNRLGGDIALAVRSSATAEDSASFSFAGLHDSILDVRTLPSLEAAVRQCWASLWSDRALAYRRNGGLAADDAGIAVVVQQMIRSDVSFVAFTADPVSGRESHLAIAASYGLGEAIVSGLVTPDHVVVGPDGTVVEYAIGDKAMMVIPGIDPEDGPREVPTPRALRAAPALSPEQAAAIAALTRGLAAHLGYQADFEGALAGDQIVLFQARPITTLSPPGLGASGTQARTPAATPAG